MKGFAEFTVEMYQELGRAEALHGDWSDKNHIQCFDKIADELEEVYEAICENDIHGAHGIKAESIQVAVTAFKLWRRVQQRPGKSPGPNPVHFSGYNPLEVGRNSG
jgi:hypothetical protein